VDTAKLERALADKVNGEVRFDAGTRGAYAHDGSDYRMPPLGVVLPRNADAAVAAVEVCAEFGAPLLSRGGGTSLAGQCCNTAVVIDWAKYCHQHAIMGFDPDTEILHRCGVDVEVLDTGCCGLAGNFGFERVHYEVSAACAERGLWPAARSAEPGTAVLADGFSCRTQLAAGRSGRQGLHLAQLLAELTAD
jgi:Fe-S oxidoreductase